MKFSEFFESWLNKNYYANAVNIGKRGDFYTAVSVGSFFGICIAREILRLREEFYTKFYAEFYENSCANFAKHKISLVEIGANEGFLLADIVQAIYTFDADALGDFDFVIIEPHEKLRATQIATFSERFGDEVSLTHFASPNEAKFENAIFIANELFDAFKCEVVDGEKMLYIEDFKPVFREISDSKISQIFSANKGEIPLDYENFARSLNAEHYAFLAFDYGEMGARGDFTLRVYKNHKVFDFFEISDLRELYGASDITYSVNFEILSRAFGRAGAKMRKFCSFERALVEFGASEILELFAQKMGENGYKNALSQFNHLRAEFGEKFKYIEFRKGF